MKIDFDVLRAKLYTAVLSDTLDGLGRRAQAMRPFIRPLSEEDTLFGPVRTGLFIRATRWPRARIPTRSRSS